MKTTTTLIASIIEVVDTRTYEEYQTGKLRPISGSGDAHECDMCGALHEVHVHALTTAGERINVGTECANLDKSLATNAKEQAKKAARRAIKRARIAALESARKLQYPPVVFVVNGEGAKYTCGDVTISGPVTQGPRADTIVERTKERAIEMWQERRAQEILTGKTR